MTFNTKVETFSPDALIGFRFGQFLIVSLFFPAGEFLLVLFLSPVSSFFSTLELSLDVSEELSERPIILLLPMLVYSAAANAIAC